MTAKQDDTLILCGAEVSGQIRNSIGGPQVPLSFGTFPSNESFAEPMFDGTQHGKRLYIVQSTSGAVDKNVMSLCFMIDTAKKAGVEEVVVIAPFAAYGRQDRSFPGRYVSEGANMLGRFLKEAGADQFITITPHSKNAEAAYGAPFGAGNFIALSTTDLFAKDIQAHFGENANLVIGAPDGADKKTDEGQQRAESLIRSVFKGSGKPLGLLNKENRFYIKKVHEKGTFSTTKITEFSGDVAGKDCIIVDDMSDSGGTIKNAAKLLREKGARSVTAYLTHAILTGNALEETLRTVDRFVVTDTIPDVQKKIDALKETHPDLAARVTVLSVGQMVAQEIASHREIASGYAQAVHGGKGSRGQVRS